MAANEDMGIDKVGPKVRDTGPYDGDGPPVWQCVDCRAEFTSREPLTFIEGYGLYCEDCLEKRLA